MYLKQLRFQCYFLPVFTYHTFISLIENIQKSVDDKQIASGVFINLEKVFDNVDHTILLNKL